MEKRPYFRSIRGKITNRTLLIGLLPVAVVGAVAWYSLTQLTNTASSQLDASRSDLLDRVVGANLTATANRVVQQIDSFMLERISDAVTWASAPTVVQAAREAARVHIARGFNDMTIDEVESRFQDVKSLNVAPRADEYLRQQIETSPHFGEVFFTDAGGYNTALTNPTSDFVQRDENWWKTAWENGLALGEVEYDDSAGIWSIEISVRIDDPDSGNSLGVMKAVLGVSLIQEVASTQAGEIASGKVTVVNSNGLLLAETASGHDSSRIMNSVVNLRESSDGDLDTVFGNQRRGYVLGAERVIGFARSAGAELYSEVVSRFDGFAWTVIVEQPNEVALAPIEGLSSIQTNLARSQQQILYVLGGAIAAVLLLSLIVASTLSRSITEPLFQLREAADAVSKGDTSRSIDVHSDDEIKDLAVAFERMRTSVAIIIQRFRKAKQ